MSMELVKTDQAPEKQQITIPDVLPVLPLPDLVVFPYMIVPLFVNRDHEVYFITVCCADRGRNQLAIPQVCWRIIQVRSSS